METAKEIYDMQQFDINRQAKATGRFEIEIGADRTTVWSRLADLASWPQWNASVKRMSLDGPVAVGTVFHWTAGGIPIRSRLEVVEKGALLGWTGQSPGIRARHVWRIDETPGGTRVTTEESFDGVLSTLFPNRMKQAIGQALSQGAGALKDACEPR